VQSTKNNAMIAVNEEHEASLESPKSDLLLAGKKK